MAGGIEPKGARRPSGYGPTDRRSSYPPVSGGTRGRVRPGGVAAQGAARVDAGADGVLQLRVGVRADRLRRQADVRDPQARGQSGPSGFPRSQLRQGSGDDQPDHRSRADPLSAAPQGRPGRRRVGAGELGPRARHVRRADARGVRRRAPQRCLYFVGRPGEDGFAERFLETWGCDGHNSHTNVCSSGGRAGYGLWSGTDRPSPDYANARFMLLISAHLESGHYFNPHAQRIIEGKQPARRSR